MIRDGEVLIFIFRRFIHLASCVFTSCFFCKDPVLNHSKPNSHPAGARRIVSITYTFTTPSQPDAARRGAERIRRYLAKGPGHVLI